MNRSQLTDILSQKQPHLAYQDVDQAVKILLEHMSRTLAADERIEIRGFGSFALNYRPPRVGRNPQNGDSVTVPGKYVPHFKPGKELKKRVNGAARMVPSG